MLSFVLAQVGTAPGAGAPPLATYRGIDLSPLLGALIAIIGAAITWIANRAQKSSAKANDEVAKTSRAERALLKLGVIAAGMSGRAWDRIGPAAQAALADGRIDAAERAHLEAIVQGLLRDFSSEDDLKEITEALGLPLPGIVAKIAAMVLGRFTQAHDEVNTEVSALEFPVAMPRAAVVSSSPADIARIQAGVGAGEGA